LLPFVPAAVFFQGGHGDAAAALGWVAIGAGLLGTVPFMLYVRVKKISVAMLRGGDTITRELALQHKPILNVHIALNLVGFAAGAAHGIALLQGLDVISLSLTVVMSITTASGIVLWFASSRSTRLFTKILHTQIVMSALLAVLVVLHVLEALFRVIVVVPLTMT
jgi:type IV secretory pathway TrbD component